MSCCCEEETTTPKPLRKPLARLAWLSKGFIQELASSSSDGDGKDDDIHIVVNEQVEEDEGVGCGHNCDDEAVADGTNTKGDPICGWGIVMAEDCLCGGRRPVFDC